MSSRTSRCLAIRASKVRITMGEDGRPKCVAPNTQSPPHMVLCLLLPSQVRGRTHRPRARALSAPAAALRVGRLRRDGEGQGSEEAQRGARYPDRRFSVHGPGKVHVQGEGRAVGFGTLVSRFRFHRPCALRTCGFYSQPFVSTPGGLRNGVEVVTPTIAVAVAAAHKLVDVHGSCFSMWSLLSSELLVFAVCVYPTGADKPQPAETTNLKRRSSPSQRATPRTHAW